VSRPGGIAGWSPTREKQCAARTIICFILPSGGQRSVVAGCRSEPPPDGSTPCVSCCCCHGPECSRQGPRPVNSLLRRPPFMSQGSCPDSAGTSQQPDDQAIKETKSSKLQGRLDSTSPIFDGPPTRGKCPVRIGAFPRVAGRTTFACRVLSCPPLSSVSARRAACSAGVDRLEVQPVGTSGRVAPPGSGLGLVFPSTVTGVWPSSRSALPRMVDIVRKVDVLDDGCSHLAFRPGSCSRTGKTPVPFMFKMHGSGSRDPCTCHASLGLTVLRSPP